jgi:hypothetical protein
MKLCHGSVDGNPDPQFHVKSHESFGYVFLRVRHCGRVSRDDLEEIFVGGDRSLKRYLLRRARVPADYMRQKHFVFIPYRGGRRNRVGAAQRDRGAKLGRTRLSDAIIFCNALVNSDTILCPECVDRNNFLVFMHRKSCHLGTNLRLAVDLRGDNPRVRLVDIRKKLPESTGFMYSCTRS